MPYDDPSLKRFENYYLSHKPSERELREYSEGKVAQALPKAKSGKKKVVRKGLSEKGCQKTSDRLISLLKDHPRLTQDGMAKAIGISRQAIQKHLRNLKASGRLRRVGPDKGGHWEVIA